MKVYDYIYKANLRVFYKIWKSDYPEWNAVISIPLVICLNLIIIVIKLDLDIIIEHYIKGEIAMVLLFVFIMFLNYLLFIKGDRYKEIISSFENEHNKQSNFNLIIGLIFTIGGYLFPVLYILFNVKPVY